MPFREKTFAPEDFRFGTTRYTPGSGEKGGSIVLSANRVSVVSIEDLAAGADITARAEFCAPADGCTLTKIGIVPKGSSAGIDNSNTAVIAVADADANSIVSKTYNTATQPPAANAYETLGSLSSTHKVLTANEVVTVAVTQGATANLPAFLLVFEWEPTAS